MPGRFARLFKQSENRALLMMSGCVPEQESESAPESNSFAEMYGKNLTAPIVTVEQSPPLRGRGLKHSAR